MMPSNLRLQLDISSTQSLFPTTARTPPHPSSSASSSPHSSSSSPPSSPPAQQRQKMSLSQTYRIASTARTKLGSEASRADHDLRLLVGHANLLDSLMLELASAEREQEACFNQTVRSAHKGESPKHIQWFDSIAEELQDDYAEDEEADSDLDYDYEVDYRSIASSVSISRRRSLSPPAPHYPFSASSHTCEYDSDEEGGDDDDDDDDDMAQDYDEDEEELALTRLPSHTPELFHEEMDTDDSEDESLPPSPSQPTLSVIVNQPPKPHFDGNTWSSMKTRVVRVLRVEEINLAPMVTAY